MRHTPPPSLKAYRRYCHDLWLRFKESDYERTMNSVINSYLKLAGTWPPTEKSMYEWHCAMVREEKSPSTINSYFTHFKVWLRKGGMEVPAYGHYKKGVFTDVKPATSSDYWTIMKYADPGYDILISVLHFSGLRLGEALKLSWTDPPFRIDETEAGHLFFKIWPEGQKNRRPDWCPTSPEFRTFLHRLPGPRKGLVAGLEVGVTTASAVISDIAKHCGLNITAKSFRAGFATRWAPRVKPAVLARLMRHKSWETTNKYYVRLDVDQVSELTDALYDAEHDKDLASIPFPNHQLLSSNAETCATT